MSARKTIKPNRAIRALVRNIRNGVTSVGSVRLAFSSPKTPAELAMFLSKTYGITI